MEQQGRSTATQSKIVLAEMLDVGRGSRSDRRREGIRGSAEQTRSDDLVAQVVDAHPAEWDRYREGDDKVSGLFIRRGDAGLGPARRREER